MMQQRLAGRFKLPGPSEEAVEGGREVQELHVPAVRWLTEHGIAFIHCRPDKRTMATEGAPDFTIAAREGRVVFVEFKTREGKLSEEQRTWIFLAARAGTTVRVLRNFDSFLALMKENGIE